MLPFEITSELETEELEQTTGMDSFVTNTNILMSGASLLTGQVRQAVPHSIPTQANCTHCKEIHGK